MEFDTSLVIPYQARLASMMARRHRIVHRADREDEFGSGKHAAASLGQDMVYAWIAAVRGFCTDVIAELRDV